MEQSTERVIQKRAEFWEQVHSIAKERLLFLDESSCQSGLCPLYGYTEKKQRLVAKRTVNRGLNVTMVGALSSCGFVAMEAFPGSLNRERFASFLQNTLLPHVSPGHVLVLDNLSAHKGKEIDQVVASFGCSLLYLAPYCPQDNPIELSWSFLKSHIRKDRPLSVDERMQSIKNAVPRLTKDHALAFFRHCGYP